MDKVKTFIRSIPKGFTPLDQDWFKKHSDCTDNDSGALILKGKVRNLSFSFHAIKGITIEGSWAKFLDVSNHRNFTVKDVQDFIDLFKSITGLDISEGSIAYFEYGNNLPVEKHSSLYAASFGRPQNRVKTWGMFQGHQGFTLYYGDNPLKIRIYDKNAELKSQGFETDQENLLRCEMVVYRCAYEEVLGQHKLCVKDLARDEIFNKILSFWKNYCASIPKKEYPNINPQLLQNIKSTKDLCECVGFTVLHQTYDLYDISDQTADLYKWSSTKRSKQKTAVNKFTQGHQFLFADDPYYNELQELVGTYQPGDHPIQVTPIKKRRKAISSEPPAEERTDRSVFPMEDLDKAFGKATRKKK